MATTPTLDEELLRYKEAVNNTPSFFQPLREFGEDWVLITVSASPTFLTALTATRPPLFPPRPNVYVTDEIINLLLESDNFLKTNVTSVFSFHSGRRPGRLLKLSPGKANVFLEKNSMKTIKTRNGREVTIRFQRPPARNAPAPGSTQPQGTRVAFTNVPESVVTCKPEDSKSKLTDWAKTIIQFDDGNEIVDAMVAAPPASPNIVTDKVWVTFKKPPLCLVLNEARALQHHRGFTRNTTLDQNFSAPRYSWGASNKKCSHCHVQGHSFPDCPVKDKDFSPVLATQPSQPGTRQNSPIKQNPRKASVASALPQPQGSLVSTLPLTVGTGFPNDSPYSSSDEIELLEAHTPEKRTTASPRKRSRRTRSPKLVSSDFPSLPSRLPIQHPPPTSTQNKLQQATEPSLDLTPVNEPRLDSTQVNEPLDPTQANPPQISLPSARGGSSSPVRKSLFKSPPMDPMQVSSAEEGAPSTLKPPPLNHGSAQ